jgi:hypothetical protein
VSLVEFLRARVDEDETAAKAARDDPTVYGVEGSATEEFVRLAVNEGASEAVAEHIARHDPARVLAEVDAKRRVLARHRPYRLHPATESLSEVVMCVGCGYEGPNDDPRNLIDECPELREMALPYAGHPVYREEWLP